MDEKTRPCPGNIYISFPIWETENRLSNFPFGKLQGHFQFPIWETDNFPFGKLTFEVTMEGMKDEARLKEQAYQKAYQKIYRASHGSQLAASQRAYYASHRAEIAARNKAWAASHKPQIAARMKAYQQSPIQKDYHRTWYARNRKKVLARMKAYWKARTNQTLQKKGKIIHGQLQGFLGL